MPEIIEGEAIAVFDFDGTLYRHDSFIAFARFARGDGAFACALARSLPWLAGWKLGLCTNSTAKQHLFAALYKCMTAEEFAELGRQFADKAAEALAEAVVEAFCRHLAMGHRVYVITASVGEWVSPVVERLGDATVMATVAEVGANGRLTGRFSTPNCYGPEKVRRLRAVEPHLGSIPMYVYTDSHSDDPLLSLATHRILV